MKKAKKKRTRKPRVQIKVEAPAEQTIGANGGEKPIGEEDARIAEMIQAAHRVSHAEGERDGQRIERRKLLDGICARIAFYEASAMKPVTMTISWHEALVILEHLQANGHGFKEQRALATQKQWRVVPDPNRNMVASYE